MQSLDADVSKAPFPEVQGGAGLQQTVTEQLQLYSHEGVHLQGWHPHGDVAVLELEGG